MNDNKKNPRDTCVDMGTRIETNESVTDKHEQETFGEIDDGYLNADLAPVYGVKGNSETDPSGINQHITGAKLDFGKPDMSLLLMFGKALSEVAQVGTGGKIKYTRGGWQDVDDGINRYTAAMLRHAFKEHYEEMDKDLMDYLGVETYHAAHTAWNALARLELMLRIKEE